jgi:16S rRNA (uracil1498-N3)-methyltransferase
MNLILFAQAELDHPLPRDDIRAQHILGVLRLAPGDSFDVGLIDGPRGKALLTKISETGLQLEFRWGPAEPDLDPITLIVGLSRPQTNRKILQEATALGVRRMLFVLTERGEPTYASSRLWTTGEYRRHVLTGVEQAFSTRVPEVEFGMPLATALDDLAGAATRVALDNYEHTRSLASVTFPHAEPVSLAVGSERGWTGNERTALRQHGYVLAGMGPRVLRTETAVIAGLALVKAGSGVWDRERGV